MSAVWQSLSIPGDSTFLRLFHWATTLCGSMGPYYIDDGYLPHRKLGSIQSWLLGNSGSLDGILHVSWVVSLDAQSTVVTSQATLWCALGCWICRSPLVASSVRAGCCHPWWWSLGLRNGQEGLRGRKGWVSSERMDADPESLFFGSRLFFARIECRNGQNVWSSMEVRFISSSAWFAASSIPGWTLPGHGMLGRSFQCSNYMVCAS